MQSEFEFIARHFQSESLAFSLPGIDLGIGDDCAVLSIPVGTQLVQSMDTLVADTHFPSQADPFLIACRSMAVNLSDLAAMGAEPFCFSLALSLPDEIIQAKAETWLSQFAKGLTQYAQQHRCPLVGGDTTKGPLSITLLVQGTVPAGQAICRSGAQVGDRIYVTGNLGDAALALPLLGLDSHLSALVGVAKNVLSGQDKQHFLDAYFKPQPPLHFGKRLGTLVNSAIDISDGLIGDLGHICTRSQVAAQLNVSALPFSKPANANFGNHILQAAALGGGDDYQLCFTAAQENSSKLEAVAKAEGVRLSYIGDIVAKAQTSTDLVTIKDKQGNTLPTSPNAYDHFNS